MYNYVSYLMVLLYMWSECLIFQHEYFPCLKGKPFKKRGNIMYLLKWPNPGRWDPMSCKPKVILGYDDLFYLYPITKYPNLT